MAKKITKTKSNNWQLLVRQMRAQHPNLTFKEVLEIAKTKYNKPKQSGGALPKKPIGIAPIMRIPKQPKNALQ